MNYIPINIKTNYELLSSLIKLDDLILFAKENNISTLGITDSNMFGSIEFYNKCISNDIKPIIGISVTLYEKEFILYARNYNGYMNLCKIVTKKNLDILEIDFLRDNNSDIICVVKPDIELFKLTESIYSDIFISYENIGEKKEALIISKNIVFSNEILYLNESDSEYLEYLYMIRDGETIYNHRNYKLNNNHYLRNILEIDSNTTKAFADLIDFKLPEFIFSLPKYSDNSKELLVALCKKGLNKRLNNNVSENYIKRLSYELSVIEKMGFIDYFLIVYDFILYAKKNGIVVGPGRGSAAGSLVSYSLGITDINPIEFNLIFERFLNPDRITMPDIDIDFEYLRRDEIVRYVSKKYGKENVASIITFGTLLPKQVIRDVGRILEINLPTIDKICKLIDDHSTLKEIINKTSIRELLQDNEIKKLFEISMKLENLKRHTSIHAAGVVISPDSLTNKMPLYKSGDNILTSYTMEYMEELGLLKMDFLALKNLSIIDNIVKRINDKDFDLNKIPLNDEKTIKLFYDVNTVGIFQFESEGMKSFLREYKVESFDDLVAAIALYRPGPKDMIPTYIKRKRKLEKVDCIVPELNNILRSTYGIIIYQEQIMEILRTIASYSYAEADNIRRAMSKKKEAIILKEKENFINRSLKNGFEKEKAEEIYNVVLKFANYGFNKAHSVAYSLVSYRMGYLKAHYPAIFMTCLLNMVIGREIKINEYFLEAKILGLKFKEIDINESEYEFINTKEYIRYPLSIIKGVGKATIDEIVKERIKGKFLDIFDFMRRTYSKSVNKKVIESLIDSGALKEFGYNNHTLKESLDELINYAILCRDLDESLVLKPEINVFKEYDSGTLINIEYNTFGFYINNHPVTKYTRNEIRLNEIKNYFDKYIKILLLIENVKTINTKNGDKMAFLILSDETDKIDAVIFPKLYQDILNLDKGDIALISGKVEKRRDTYQIIINKLKIMRENKND